MNSWKGRENMELKAVKEYLRVDYDDDDPLISRIMKAAESYIVDAVGRYDSGNEKANLLLLAIVQDLYDNRTLTVTEQQKKQLSYTFSSIILQLQYRAEVTL